MISIRRRISHVVGLTLLVVMSALFLVTAHIVIDGFLAVETDLTKYRLECIRDGIEYQGRHLAIKLVDWADWDDTYNFILDKNPEYIRSNLISDTLENLKLDWMLFVDSKMQVVATLHAAPGVADSLTVIPDVDRLAEQYPTLFVHPHPDETRVGLIRISSSLYLVASRPIRTSEGAGDPRGVLIFGRRIDDSFVADFAHAIALPVRIDSLDQTQARMASTDSSMLADLEHAGEAIRRRSWKNMTASTLLHGLNGEPIAVATYDSDRPTYAQALASVGYFGIALLIGYVAAMLATVRAVKGALVDRLLGLIAQISDFEASNKFGSKVQCEGNDELSTLADVTNRLLERAEQAVRGAAEGEERFHSMADDAPIGIWMSDETGAGTYVNPACANLLGKDKGELFGDDWITALHPEDRSRVCKHYLVCLSAREPFEAESRVLTAEGESRWVLLRGIPRFDKQAEFMGFLGTVQDITEQRELENHLRTARSEAVEANKIKSEFLANMSHEIRTPMTAILGYADLLMDPAMTPADRVNHIQTIRRNGEHLLLVINDILDISKIEAGKMMIEKIPVSIVEIVEDVLRLMKVRAAERGLELNVEYNWPLVSQVITDPTRMRQILMNLIGNAIKFTPAGSVLVRVGMVREGSKSRLQVAVCDSGIGLSDSQMQNLFEAFTQADASVTRKYGGTGLGLAICKHLAGMLSGDLTVQSTLGRGSTFTLDIDAPLAQGAVEILEMPSVARAASVAPGELRLKDLRILVAEDGVDNQRLITLHLRKAGATVEIADNGRVAVEKALAASGRNEPFDVILMDMQMPELDGYGATVVLRREGYPRPIIALTAHAMASDRDKCLNVGCDEFLTKPIVPAVLIETCAKWGDKGRLKIAA